MATVKCPKCGQEVPDDKPLFIRGVATVKGDVSIRGFHDAGVVWEAHNSWDEEFMCPYCGKYSKVQLWE